MIIRSCCSVVPSSSSFRRLILTCIVIVAITVPTTLLLLLLWSDTDSNPVLLMDQGLLLNTTTISTSTLYWTESMGRFSTTEKRKQKQQQGQEKLRRRLTGGSSSSSTTTTTTTTTDQDQQQQQQQEEEQEEVFRILYILSSSSKTYGKYYGRRDKRNTKNQDRLVDLTIPILQSNVESFMTINDNKRKEKEKEKQQQQQKQQSPNNNNNDNPTTTSISHLLFQVDVYMIVSYTLNQTEIDTIRKALPDNVGLQIWEDATPYSYNCNNWPNPENPIKGGTYCQGHMYNTGRKKGPLTFGMNETALVFASAQLARQHRYVLKDKFPYYDFFVVLEDDMNYQYSHVEMHVRVMDHIRRLITYRTKSSSTRRVEEDLAFTSVGEETGDADDEQEEEDEEHVSSKKSEKAGTAVDTNISLKSEDVINHTIIHNNRKKRYKWNVELDVLYLKRMRPGFIRVEVLEKGQKGIRDDVPSERLHFRGDNGDNNNNNETDQHEKQIHHRRHQLEQIDVPGIDPTNCCVIPSHIKARAISNRMPTRDDIVIWETSLIGFKVRPWTPLRTSPRPIGSSSSSKANSNASRRFGGDDDDRDWIAAPLAGAERFPAVWAGEYLDPRPPRPLGAWGQIVAQSAGWMGSAREIMEYHTDLCEQGFMPPLDGPAFPRDGLWRHNVEFYSGGIQLWGGMCHVQRVFSLRSPSDFSKHFVYHAANNKQHSITQSRLIRANTLWEELAYVRDLVEKEVLADII